MNEINNPEQRVDKPSVEKTPEQLRSAESAKAQIHDRLDNAGTRESIETESPHGEKMQGSVKFSENHRKNILENTGADNKEKQSERMEDKEKSCFSSENLKAEKSFNYRAKSEHPELIGLKNKCVYDVPPMGTPENKFDRMPKDTYTQEERNKVKDIRDGIDAPTKNTIMQKVIGVDTGDVKKDLSVYLEPKTQEGKNTIAQVYGFVSKANDSAPFTKTPKECHDNLRLDYSGTPYNNPEQSVYVIRFKDGTNYDIPYDRKFGGDKDRKQPCTGNGFTGAKNVSIPEYEVRVEDKKGAVVTNGEIYKINPDGTEEKVAEFNKKHRTFKLCEQEDRK